MNRLLLVFVVSVLVLGVPAQSLAVAPGKDKVMPRERLSELDMPSYASEGPAGADVAAPGYLETAPGYGVAPGCGVSLEEQRRVEEEKRQQWWATWSNLGIESMDGGVMR